MQLLETYGPEETAEIGKKIGAGAEEGDIYALYGDLGAGKTRFAQGFAEGLGITEPVNSPTFTILQIYDEGRIPLYHFDVYRIEDPDEMYEVGFEEYLEGDGAALIEWAELVEELLPPQTRRITIDRDPAKGDDYRRICIYEPGERRNREQ